MAVAVRCRPDGRRTGRAAFAVLAVLPLVVGTAVAQAQAPGPDELEQFEDREFVFEVQVPVNVIARDGEPPSGG